MQGAIRTSCALDVKAMTKNESYACMSMTCMNHAPRE